MIKITVYKNKKGDINGLLCSGHAEYAEHGKDIVCSAVSVLILNTINSIEAFTSQNFTLDIDKENGGYILFKLNNKGDSKTNHDTALLLRTLKKGLTDLEASYGKYIQVKEEVQ